MADLQRRPAKRPLHPSLIEERLRSEWDRGYRRRSGDKLSRPIYHDTRDYNVSEHPRTSVSFRPDKANSKKQAG